MTKPKPEASRTPHLRLIPGGRAEEPPRAAEPEARAPELSEFYVHAVLQAARAHHLGLDIDSAESFGLNRAIFYEGIKKGYIGRGRRRPRGGTGGAGAATRPRGRGGSIGTLTAVAGEKAYAVPTRDGDGYRFVMGGQILTPKKFDRQIRRKFPDWEAAWDEAMAIMARAAPATLESASRFHSRIYRPMRAELARRWARPKAIPADARSAA